MSSTYLSLVIFSSQMQALCIRSFVTYAGLMQTGTGVAFTENSRTLSNAQVTERFRICIVLLVFVYNNGDYRDYE